jgi:hypothetical protein
MQPLAACLAVVSTTFASLAQTTWIVDAGGAGQFTEIAAAYDAATAGDTLLVRPGNYAPFERFTAKGVRILGTAPGVRIAGPLRLRNLPLGQQIVIAHLTVDAFANPFVMGVGMNNALLLQSCSNVVLNDVRCLGPAPTIGTPGVGLVLDNTTAVVHGVLARGTSNGFGSNRGGSGAVVSGGRVAFSGCTFEAGNSVAFPPLGAFAPSASLSCYANARVVVDECTMVAGTPGGRSLEADQSRVVVANRSGATQTAALTGLPGAIEFDGAVVAVASPHPLTPRAQPSLVGPTSVVPGGAIVWQVLGTPNEGFVTAASLGIVPLQLPGLFDTTTFTAGHPTSVFGLGIVGTGGSTALSLAVPNVAALEGVQVSLQVAGFLSQSILKATGVVVTTIR